MTRYYLYSPAASPLFPSCGVNWIRQRVCSPAHPRPLRRSHPPLQPCQEKKAASPSCHPHLLQRNPATSAAPLFSTYPLLSLSLSLSRSICPPTRASYLQFYHSLNPGHNSCFISSSCLMNSGCLILLFDKYSHICTKYKSSLWGASILLWLKGSTGNWMAHKVHIYQPWLQFEWSTFLLVALVFCFYVCSITVNKRTKHLTTVSTHGENACSHGMLW